MAKHEHTGQLADAIERAEAELAEEQALQSDDSGARLIAAAITLAGARIAYQLARIKNK